ncbi:MAG: DUF2628 domain-containing protein [Deltaproteobacteria bacterium]|nr:DUF2628 domain-containing protein [Candidatus Anaeroferrophillus wilburensis]MBN2887933.1 DUF2628 domain-containing protein [Deltaproteobacteria bacterium]
MKTFKVYSHQWYGYEAVKQGVSWPGFFFGFIWAMVKKLQRTAAGLFMAFAVILIIDSIADTIHSTLLSLVAAGCYLALCLAAALKGNEWRSKNLETRGYILIDTIRATSPPEAIARVAGEKNQP